MEAQQSGAFRGLDDGGNVAMEGITVAHAAAGVLGQGGVGGDSSESQAGGDSVQEEDVVSGEQLAEPPGGAVAAVGNEERIIARLPRRVVLGEAVTRAGGSEIRYRTEWSAGEYATTVESRFPRGRRPHCSGTVRCRGRPRGSVSEAEEDAAERFLRFLRWRHGVVVDDVNWGRANRLRRRSVALRAAVEAAEAAKKQALLEKEQAMAEKQQLAVANQQLLAAQERLAGETQQMTARALVLERGWSAAVDELARSRDECETVCMLAGVRLGADARAADMAELRKAVLELSGSLHEKARAARFAMALAKPAAA